MAAEPEQQNIGATVAEISERTTRLVREEIELAKTEITEKITKLIKGVVVGVAAGIFVVGALVLILHGLAWLGAVELFDANQIYWGFFIVAGGLLVMAGLAGFLAARAVKAGTPPKPDMAIEEAKKIKETVTGDQVPPDVAPISAREETG